MVSQIESTNILFFLYQFTDVRRRPVARTVMGEHETLLPVQIFKLEKAYILGSVCEE